MPPPEPVDYDRLEEFLRALSHSRRLELLHLLQIPHALSEIRLAPGKERAGDRPARPLAKQSVQEHLDKLVEIGVVSVSGPTEGKRGWEYAVNPQRLYLVSEEFRKVSSVKVQAAPSRDVTVATARDAAAPAMEPGPSWCSSTVSSKARRSCCGATTSAADGAGPSGASRGCR